LGAFLIRSIIDPFETFGDMLMVETALLFFICGDRRLRHISSYRPIQEDRIQFEGDILGTKTEGI